MFGITGFACVGEHWDCCCFYCGTGRQAGRLGFTCRQSCFVWVSIGIAVAVDQGAGRQALVLPADRAAMST
jgi:hypothetical protein